MNVIFPVAVVLMCTSVLAAHAESGEATELSPGQAKRKLAVERMDRHQLRFKTKTIQLSSPEMLRKPEFLDELPGVKIARQAPLVDFVVIPVTPRIFPKPATENLPDGLWTVWGQGVWYPKAQKLYAAIGNHIYFDAQAHLVEFDSKTGTVRTLEGVNKAIGRAPEDFGDGKVHGYLDFYDGPTLYFMTYWCEYPEPSPEHWATGYDGGHLLSYNVETGVMKDLGTPLRRTSWPYHRMDRTRGALFAVGALGEFLCYDVKNQKVLWAGYPPPGITWHERSMLVDETTGCAYSTNFSKSDPEAHMVRYDPHSNRFTLMKCSVPENAESHLIDQMRANTSRRISDGSFVCVTRGGELFKFFPDEDKIQDMGLCFPARAEQLYTAAMALSPDGRFAYYIPGAHGSAHKLGTAVMQLDVHTGARKVIAFLHPFLYKQLGYVAAGTFSLNMDDKGSRLFVVMNGAFADLEHETGDVFGDPSVLVVHIPASER